MKTTAAIFLFFLAVSFSAEQVVELTGKWTMFEMSYQTDKGIQKTTEQQMKAKGSSTTFYFMEKGKFRQTGNMSGTGTMDTYDGTWKILENKLIITLHLGEQSVDQEYTFERKENNLVLTRANHDGTTNIITSFRRIVNN
jgi:hypothetical protein